MPASTHAPYDRAQDASDSFKELEVSFDISSSFEGGRLTIALGLNSDQHSHEDLRVDIQMMQVQVSSSSPVSYARSWTASRSRSARFSAWRSTPSRPATCRVCS
jgi:hypothetical protein